jgi:hypothetical protein
LITWVDQGDDLGLLGSDGCKEQATTSEIADSLGDIREDERRMELAWIRNLLDWQRMPQ